MTTTATGLLCWRDSHPLEWQLASLHQIQFVQDSLKKIVPAAATAADLFYDRLFMMAPQLRPLFPRELSVANLHQTEKILPAVQALGRRRAMASRTHITTLSVRR